MLQIGTEKKTDMSLNGTSATFQKIL